MALDVTEIGEAVKESSAWVSLLRSEIGKVIVGQQYMVDRLLVALLANGHVLLEGVPGLAKTLSIKTLSSSIKAQFKRIQFTPDLLPSDIIGTLIYNPKEGQFLTKKGPIFSNIVLADEINRAPAKVQSALLEAMQERQVTLGDTSFPLPEPFLVLATENPIDQEGTYHLPEAQVDRFMMKLKVSYPSKHEERLILDNMASTNPKHEVKEIIHLDQILKSRELVDNIYIDEKVKDYIVDIVFATRKPSTYGIHFDDFISYGASPRATIALTLAAKAWAFLKGRGFVTPQDVKTIGQDVLRHRVIVSFEAEAEDIKSEDVIKKIFDTLPVP
ncbi:MAG: ATPase [Verrucomicrobia bacterium GWC2_42_7]|nr:MAG: ATPase [Verrucomicrobia bacterium GWC2_42_7]